VRLHEPRFSIPDGSDPARRSASTGLLPFPVRPHREGTSGSRLIGYGMREALTARITDLDAWSEVTRSVEEMSIPG
jgi:hypothetical protein